MAVLERFNYRPMEFSSDSAEGLPWIESRLSRPIPNCPQIFFEDGKPWLAANIFALNYLERGNRSGTVVSVMNHLRDYAEWLEKEALDWRHFPLKKKERCLFRYRGALIERRDNGQLSPSTASARMSAVIRFYRWAKVNNWIERKKLWKDRQSEIKTNTIVGLTRTISVTSTELAIPNRKIPGNMLEGGLLPISDASRKKLLNFLKDKGMVELYLMFVIGFFTGARIETIRTLRLSSLDTALDDPSVPSLKRIPVGPPTKIKTKYDVSGALIFPSAVLEILQDYATSARRLVRQSRASSSDKTLLFLTVKGAKYAENSFTSILSKLRKRLDKEGGGEFKNLKFHQCRATFGTNLMRLCLQTLDSAEASIRFVRDAMLHKDESTTWKYITFVHNEPLKEKLSDEFFAFFSGQSNSLKSLIEETTYESASRPKN